MAYTHKITERGNGFPARGERIYDSDGNVLIVGDCSPIHTAQWQSNWIFAECLHEADLIAWKHQRLASDSYCVTEIEDE